MRAFLTEWPRRVASDLLRVEAVRACARVGPQHAAAAAAGLAGVALVPLDLTVLETAASLRPVGLRSLDALHLATALSLGDDLGLVLSYDERLLEAASNHGLDARAVV